jgi:YbbR domain-containing protein
VQRPAIPQWRRVVTPIALALLSLFAAITIWIAVTDAENPNRVAVFSGAIEVRAVNVPEGLAVASIREPSVSLRVSATEDDFAELTVADFRAEVDLSGVRQSSDQLVLARVVSDKDVEITEVAPAFVTVTLEPVATKLVPVQANIVGSPPQGYSVGDVESNPTTVRVTGATSLVNLVATAGADVTVTGLRASLQQRTELTPRDSRGADIRGVRVEPSNTDLRVPVAQQEVTLALTVVPTVQGTLADGYNLIGVSSDPPAIAVTGSLEVLQAASFLGTEPIDVTGLRADTTRTVRLRLPAGLAVARDSVSVRIRVQPASGEMTLSLAPEVTGVADGLRATLQTSTLEVRLRGQLPVLREIQPGEIKATVSAAGLSEGVQILRPEIAVPEGVEVAAIDPAQVVVVLRR